MRRRVCLTLVLILCLIFSSCAHYKGELVGFTSTVVAKYTKDEKYFVSIDYKRGTKKVELYYSDWAEIEEGQHVSFEVKDNKVVGVKVVG